MADKISHNKILSSGPWNFTLGEIVPDENFSSLISKSSMAYKIFHKENLSFLDVSPLVKLSQMKFSIAEFHLIPLPIKVSPPEFYPLGISLFSIIY